MHKHLTGAIDTKPSFLILWYLAQDVQVGLQLKLIITIIIKHLPRSLGPPLRKTGRTAVGKYTASPFVPFESVG